MICQIPGLSRAKETSLLLPMLWIALLSPRLYGIDPNSTGKSDAKTFEPISVRALPGAQCEASAAGAPTSASVPVTADEDGYARLFAVRPKAAGDAQAVTLTCKDATGDTHTFTADLGSSDAFDARPLSFQSHSGKERPALEGDGRDYTQQQLIDAGYGLRPDPNGNPKIYARWLKAASVRGYQATLKRPTKSSHQPRVTTGTGIPWVGSVLTGSPDYVSTEVEFNVPTALPGGDATTTTEVALWNGLGGNGTGSGLIQGGVTLYTTPLVASYGSWREYCCGDGDSNGYGGAFTPNPGDEIYAQNWYCDAEGGLNLKGGYGCTYVSDLTTGAVLSCTSATDKTCWSVAALPLCSANPQAPNCMTLGLSAEFIIENESPQVSNTSKAWSDFTPTVTMSGSATTVDWDGTQTTQTISSDSAVNVLTDWTNDTTHLDTSIGSNDQTYFHMTAGAQAWNQFSLSGACGTPSGHTAKALSRIPNSMEVWWICQDGSVWDAYFYDGAQPPWNQFQLAGPGSASPTGGIAALSRQSNTMEVWWVRPDGGIQDAYWYDGSAGWVQFSLTGPQTASTIGGLTAVSRNWNTMELWWTAPDGSVQDAYWYAGMPSWNHYTLSGPGSASITGKLAAVTRSPNAIELWWVRPDGGVQDAYWYEGMPSFSQFELAGANSASAQGGITAVSRASNTMELWWVGADGSVQDAYWYDGGQWNGFQLAVPGSASADAGIAAVSGPTNTMDVWWVGADGSVQDAYWYDGMPWNQMQISPSNTASLYGGITAVARQPGALELWWQRSDGGLQDQYVYQTPN
jgi:hypothetical protein